MIRKLFSRFFSDATLENRFEENHPSPTPERQLEKEAQTARKFKNIEMLTRQIKDFTFAGFSSVLKFELQFTTDFGEPKSFLTLKLVYQQAHGDYDVVLQFEDPQSLRLSSPARSFDIALVIDDISDLHWEDMKFTVDDYEEGNLSFYCSAIRVVTVAERPGLQTTRRYT